MNEINSPTDTAMVDFRRIRLEKIKLGIGMKVSKHLFDVRVEMDDEIPDKIEFNIRGYLWGEDVGTYHVQYPADWWEAFKQRWFPLWAKRRWPIKYTRQDFKWTAVYPHFRASLSPDQQFVVIAR